VDEGPEPVDEEPEPVPSGSWSGMGRNKTHLEIVRL